MSEVAESAVVRLVLADYASADAQNKLNIIGGGITLLGFDQQSKATAPFAMVAVVTFDPEFVGESPAVELTLEQENGEILALPGPPGLPPQLLRVGSSDPLSAPTAPGIAIPPGALRPRVQFIMYFSDGLPLSPGYTYTWRVKIDHETRREWTENLYVPGVGKGPVIG